jgi:hypothetical protein
MLKLYKNLASGRLFIGINEDIDEFADSDSLLLITPEGKIKRLEGHLFEQIDVPEAANDHMLQKLTPAQRGKHQEIMGSLHGVD